MSGEVLSGSSPDSVRQENIMHGLRKLGTMLMASHAPASASFDPTVIHDDRDELLEFDESDIRYLDDMYYQITTRLDTMSIYVDDVQIAKNTIFNTVGYQYATKMIPHCEPPLAEDKRVRYTVASALLAGLYLSQGPRANRQEVFTIIDERTFYPLHNFFTDDEREFITNHTQVISDAVREVSTPDDITDYADRSFEQAIETSVQQGSHPLVTLVLRAMQVGATIERPELADKHFADFLAALPKAS